MLDLRLPEEIENRLDELVRKTGRAKADFVQEAVIEYLTDLEDVYLAEKEYEAVLSGNSKLTPLAEIAKESRVGENSTRP